MSAREEHAHTPAGDTWMPWERVLKDFDKAMQRGERPALEDYLPKEAAERGAVLLELVHIELEHRLKAGETARVEGYFDRFPELAHDREAAVGLISAEFALRRRQHADVRLDEYLRRFPNYEEALLAGLPTTPAENTPPPAPLSCPHCCFGPIAMAADTDGASGTCPSCGKEIRWSLQETVFDQPSNKLLSGNVAGVHSTDQSAPGSAPAAELPRGRRGPFTILRRHARGGLGQVSVARDETMGRLVALKEIRPDYAGDAHLRQRFLTEAAITGSLQHPGIVPIYALARDGDGTPYYAMRFIEGQTLAEAIADYHQQPSPIAFRILLKRFIDVCQTIAYAHSQAIIHRDLKPANVMVGDFGETLVLDWGLAKKGIEGTRSASGEVSLPSPEAHGSQAPAALNTSLTQAGQVLGTPAYMAPEQAEGRADLIGPATDIFALGAILYHILTGEAPYHGGDAAAILIQARQARPPAPAQIQRGVPRALECICRKSMARNFDERYASAADLARDVERWLADEPVSAYPEPWTLRARRWVKYHRLAVTGVAAALVVAVMCLGLATFLLTLAYERERQAKGLAQTNAHIANQEREEADRQRDEAIKSLRLGRAAVEQMLTRVGDERLRYVPALQKMRRELLTDALGFLRQFLAYRGNDPDLRFEAARAYQRAGDIHALLGENDPALNAYQQALDLLASLKAEFPARPDHSAELASAWNNRGKLLRTAGRMPETDVAWKQALDLRQELADQNPTVPAYRRDLALSLSNLGVQTEQVKGQLNEAEKLYGKAQSMQERLVQEWPKAPDYRRDLGRTLQNLGGLKTRLGHPVAAADMLRRARQLQEQLLDEYPDNAEYRNDLAGVLVNLGLALLRAGQNEAAEKAWQDSIAQYERLARDYPMVPDYQLRKARGHSNLGALRAQAGHTQPAEQEFRQGVEILEKLVADFAGVPAYRAELATVHGNLGVFLKQNRRLGDAETALRRAAELAGKLADEMPRTEYKESVALWHLNLGNVLKDLDKPDAAAQAYRRSLALYEQIARDNPNIPEYHSRLAAVLNNLSGFVRKQDRLKEAQTLIERAITAQQRARQLNPRNPVYANTLTENYASLALTLIMRGDHREAAKTAEQIPVVLPNDAEADFKVACLLAPCKTLAERDAQLTAAQQKELGKNYEARAYAALRSAIQKGYRDVDQLRQIPDLKSLRGSAEFLKIVQDLESIRAQRK